MAAKTQKTQTAKTAKTGKRSARKSASKASRTNARAPVYVKAKPDLDKIEDGMRIKHLTKENPRRKGSGAYDIYDTMLASRTVGEFTEHEGCGKRWLAGAVARGLIELHK